MDARARFASWTEEHFGSQDEAAKALAAHMPDGCSRSMVQMVIGGARRPGLDLCFAIEAATADWDKGPIKASEWSRATTEPTTPRAGS